MPHDPRSDAGSNVGERVRLLRQARGMSSAELARQAGLSKAALSNIETGSGNPTITTLDALSVALALPLADLIAGAEAPESSIHVRSTTSRPNAVTRELVQRLPGSFTVEIWRLRMPAGRVAEGSPHIHGTVESLLVARGQLYAGAVGDERELGEGDCLSFPGDRPHRYRTGDQPADVTVLIASPQTLLERPIPGPDHGGL